MAQEGLIIGSLLRLWGVLCVLWRDSESCRLLRRFKAFLSCSLDGSAIIGLLRRDWDRGVRAGRWRTTELVNRIGAAVRNGKGFCAALNDSLILRIADDKYIFALLCVMALGIPFLPTLVLAGLGIVCFMLYVLGLLMGRFKAEKPGFFGLALMGFALCYALSSFTSLTFPASVKVMAVFLAMMAVIPAMKKCLNTRRRVELFCAALVIAGVAVSLYGIYQYITGVEIESAWVDSSNYSELTSRAYATFGNPNVLGEFLIITDALCFGLLWQQEGQFKKFMYLGSADVMSVCIYLTGSRGAMLGILFAALLFALLEERRLLPFVVLGVAALPFVMPESVLSRFMGAVNMTDSSSKYRVSIYIAGINMICEYWLTGIGVDSFNQIYPQFALTAANSYHAHNLFLQVFIELGFLGILLLLIVLTSWFQRLYRGKRAVGRGWSFLVTAIFAGMAGLLLQGMFDNLWFNYSIIALFWITTGLGSAAAEVEK